MAWCYISQSLVKETSFTGFIWHIKLNSWPFWKIFMQCHSLITCIILPFLIFFPVFNVARFVTSGYLDKKFIVFCHTSLPSKSAWGNVLSVVGNYSQFVLLLYIYIYNTPHHWSWEALFTAWLKIFMTGVYYTWFLVCIFELILFSPRIENILRSWFIDGANMLNHLNPGLFELIFLSPRIKDILRSWFIDEANMLNHLNPDE